MDKAISEGQLTDFDFEKLKTELRAAYIDGAPAVEDLIGRAAQECDEEQWRTVANMVGSEVQFYSSRPRPI